MDETYTTQAIVLNRTDFRERDTRTVVYSFDYGKLELVARGTKNINSKLAGHIEPLCLTNIMVIRGRQFDYLGTALSETCFKGIKNDLDKLQIAGQAINIFNKLVKLGERDTEIFCLLKNYLEIVNNIKIDHQLFLHFFILKLFTRLGYRPELSRCVVCRKEIKSDGNFSLNKGGLICNLCNFSKKYKNNLTIAMEAIKILRTATKINLMDLAKIKLNPKTKKEVITIISSFRQFYTP